MELPIDQKDLKIIVNALSLGGDARLYHKLKEVREEFELAKIKIDVLKSELISKQN